MMYASEVQYVYPEAYPESEASSGFSDMAMLAVAGVAIGAAIGYKTKPQVVPRRVGYLSMALPDTLKSVSQRLGLSDAEVKAMVLKFPGTMGSSKPKALQEELKLSDAEVFWLEKKLEGGANPAWAGGETNVVASLETLKKAALVGGLKWLDAQPIYEGTLKDVPAE